MQENEFEKQVRKEMDEFRLRPAAEVWQKVEAQLRAKKKRRAVIFILLLAGLILVGSTGYFFLQKNNRYVAQMKNENLPELKNPGDGNKKESNEHASNTVRPVGSEKDEPINEKAKNKRVRDNTHVNLPTTGTEIHDRMTGKQPQRTGSNLKTSTGIPGEAKGKSSGKKILPSKSETPGEQNDVSELVKADGKTRQTHRQDEAPEGSDKTLPGGIDAKSNTGITGNTPEEDPARQPIKNDSLQSETGEISKGKSPTSLKKQSGLKWGVEFSVGISNSGNRFFSLGALPQNADPQYSSPGSNNNNNGQTPGNPWPFSFNPPSAVKAGPAFKAGVVVEKQITRRSSLVAGLRYAYLSNNITTGVYKDTVLTLDTRAAQFALNSVYSGKHQREYVNRYHFAEIPISYQWQISKRMKLPLHWNVGLSAGYLVSSHALVYDTSAGGIYYRDKNVYHKLQLNLNTGLFLTIPGKKTTWSLGPEIAVAGRRLLKDYPEDKQYLLYGALTGRLYFHKKK